MNLRFALTVVLSCAFGVAHAELQSADELATALKDGGFVIYLRHARTDKGIDVIRYNVDAENIKDCTRQRDIDAQGELDSRDIGEAFRKQGIPVGRVLASPYCRTRKTAQIAFGETLTRDEDGLATVCQASGALFDQRAAKLRAFLAEPPAPGTNTVLVSHNCNIRALAKDLPDACAYDLGMGDAVVFRPRADDKFELVGCITLDTFKSWSVAGN